MTHWEKVDRLLELVDAVREITYYINQRPPRFDIDFWMETRKRLINRIADLEEYNFINDLDIPDYYNMEKVREQTIEFLHKQGAFRHDDTIYDKK